MHTNGVRSIFRDFFLDIFFSLLIYRRLVNKNRYLRLQPKQYIYQFSSFVVRPIFCFFFFYWNGEKNRKINKQRIEYVYGVTSVWMTVSNGLFFIIIFLNVCCVCECERIQIQIEFLWNFMIYFFFLLLLVFAPHFRINISNSVQQDCYVIFHIELAHSRREFNTR